LELKESKSWGFEQALVGAVRRSGEMNHVIVISFDAAALAEVRRTEPTVMTGLLDEKPSLQSIEKAQELGVRQFLPRADRVTPEIIAAAHQADLRVVVWTVNEIGDMRTMMAAGVDGIISDYPDRLRGLEGP
jgi:glycerophosphoryl diester phosphodiesterase